MKVLIVFSALVVVAMCKPFHVYNYGVAAPLRYGSAEIATPLRYNTPLKVASPLRYEYAAPLHYEVPVTYAREYLEPVSMHHDQDSAGEYKFGFATPTQTREEARAIDGTTYGTYSYVDANGVTQTVNYQADALRGFTVEATNLPVAPSAAAVPEVEALVPIAETAEVIEARAAHMKAYNDALNGVVAEVSVPVVDAALIPQQVEDEPAVKLAKAEHLALKAKITAEHAALAAAEGSYLVEPVERIEVMPKLSSSLKYVSSPKYIVPKMGYEGAWHQGYYGALSPYYGAHSGAYSYGYNYGSPLYHGRYLNYYKK